MTCLEQRISLTDVEAIASTSPISRCHVSSVICDGRTELNEGCTDFVQPSQSGCHDARARYAILNPPSSHLRAFLRHVRFYHHKAVAHAGKNHTR